MPKLDLTRARAIRGAFGSARAIKGAGFSWAAPVADPLAQYHGIGPGQIPFDLPLHDPAQMALGPDNSVSMVRNAGGAGAAFDATAALGQRPVWNGSRLVFDGVDDFFSFSAPPDLNGAHLVAAVRRVGTDSQVIAGGSGANIWVYPINNGDARIRFTAPGISHYPLQFGWPEGVWVTFQHRLSEGHSTLWVNGDLISSIAVTQSAAPVYYLGRGGHASLYRWRGSMARMVAVTTAPGHSKDAPEPAVAAAVAEVAAWVAQQ